MSTKTSIKRIALVAVSALGFGLLSVVPAKANTATISAVNPGNASVFRAGSDAYQLEISTSGIANGTRVYATWLASEDADTTLLTNLPGIDAGEANTDVNTLAEALDGSATDGEAKNTEDASGWVFQAATTAYSTVGVAAGLLLHIDEELLSTAGDYSIRIWADIDATGTFTSGDASLIRSWTMGGTPTDASCSFSVNPVNSADNTTTVLTCRFTDADKVLTRENATDDFQWTFATVLVLDDGAGDASDISFGETIGNNSQGGGSGVYTDNVLTGSGAAASTGLKYFQIENGTTVIEDDADLGIALRIVTRAADADVTSLSVVAGQTGVYSAAASVTGTAGTVTASTSASTIYFALSGTPAAYVQVDVAQVATAPAVDLVPSTTYRLLGTDGTIVIAVTNPTPVAGEKYTITAYEDGVGDPVLTVTYADDEPTLARYAPSGNFTSKTGSTNTVTVIARDAFNNALANASVTVTVAGRNPGNATATTTDASGLASFTLKDVSTATTTDKPTDTVTFTVTDADGDTATATYTITYSTTGPVVGSVTLTTTSGGGSGAAADADASLDRNMTVDTVVSQGSAASFSYATVTAQLKGTTGAPLGSGVVVTFTGGADDLFGTTAVVANMRKSLDVTTGSTGEAQVFVYRTKTGSTTVTATAAGVSSTSPALTWLTDDSAARTIEVAADPAKAVSEGTIRIVGTVKDRYGNVVPGVDVTLSEIGAGRLASGQDNNETTGATGQVAFDMTSNAKETGTGTVTLTITESGAQSEDPAGRVLTSTVAGVTAGVDSASTTIEFTTDTSVSTADALLELAKAIGTGNSANAAADAALEAIDAANAATDAANLAAEAADAATVAAEEARDAADAATAAVEALASEVATLVAALKAQITTLANTVAKIARKVKA